MQAKSAAPTVAFFVAALVIAPTIDSLLQTTNHYFFAFPFVLPIVIIAVVGLKVRYATIGAVLAILIAGFLAFLDEAPLVLVLFQLASLVAIAYLAIQLRRQKELADERLRTSERALSQAHEINERLVISGVRLQELEEIAENAQQEAEEEKARLETILASAANAILYFDVVTKNVVANPTAERLFGHRFEPIQGSEQYADQLCYPNGQPIPLDHLPSQRALRGETIAQEEMVLVRPTGERIPVYESAAPVRGSDGAILGAVVVLQDASAIKELERAREEWTSLIAHDLRQPVALILGYAGILTRRLEKRGEEDAEKKATLHIQTAARNLNRMIGDLLDASRIEARRLRLELQIVDLPELIASVSDRLSETMAQHPVQVRINGRVPPVLADPSRVEQILTNLLTNAEKYSFPNSEILVEVCSHKPEKTVEVAVTDRGPGLSADEIPHLFTRFYRTRSAEAGKVAGLGMGLYITKGLLEAQGGRIWVESTPGQTTTFHFTLPEWEPTSNGVVV